MFVVSPKFEPLAAVAILACFLSSGAVAHQRGQYAVDEFFVLDLRNESMRFEYLAHLAEVPTLKEWLTLDSDDDGVVTEVEKISYVEKRLPDWVSGLRIEAADTPIALKQTEGRAELFLNELGLEELRIHVAANGAWPSNQRANPSFDLRMVSTLFPEKNGLFEITLLIGEKLQTSLSQRGAALQEGISSDGQGTYVFRNSEPRFSFHIESRSDDLDRAAASSPRTAERPGRSSDYTPGASWIRRIIAILESKDISIFTFLFGLLIAVGMGMGHALSPGHGKTVMAAYLIGERGTYWHAIVLGLTVTITHTWSVFLLGLLTLAAGAAVSEDRITFWTGVVSGVIIAGIGLVLLTNRIRDLRHFYQAVPGALGRSHDHSHPHAHSEHRHHHAHHHDHHHGTNEAPGFANILWLGISGGIVPCPAALIVLLLALKLGRLPYGLALIAAFSAGLAIVLVAIGIVVVRGAQSIRKKAGERPAALVILPVFSSALITLLGSAVVFWTLLQYGIIGLGS